MSRQVLAEFGDHVVLPVDFAVVDGEEREELRARDLPDDRLIVDVGHETVATYANAIAAAGTVFVNGPLGIYEKAPSEYGTRKIWEAVAESSAHTTIGGGDTISAANKYSLRDRFDYVCTAGGGMVRFLSGEELPVVTALKAATARFG